MGLISRVSSRTYRNLKTFQRNQNMSDQLKQLRIQAGVVKRNAKELVYYRKEQGEIRTKMDKMKNDGEEDYYIGKQNELLTEATEKLELMGTCDQDPTVMASKEFCAAKESL